MKKKVTKAVIPAAGLGTRFLPATKAMPKEMLPVVDKPVIQYVVEELVASGIEDIVIVTGWHKRAVEDHFDNFFELEQKLLAAGKERAAEEIAKIAKLANFIYIRQKGPYGNGTPLLDSRAVLGDEPFMYIWGDEFIYSEVKPRTAQMIAAYEELGGPVLSSMRIPNPSDLSKYGIAEVRTIRDGVHELLNIVEKPKPEEAPSNLAVLGAYLLTPDILPIMAEVKPGKGDEIWLVDGINGLKVQRPIYTIEVVGGQYYDIGNKLGFLRANIEFGLRDPKISQDLQQYLQSLDLSKFSK